MWPCPRTRQELITHPSKPSESRIDTLKEPWVENELSGGRLEETAEGSGGNKLPHYLAWRKKFDTVPSNGNTIFGGFQVRAWLFFRCALEVDAVYIYIYQQMFDEGLFAGSVVETKRTYRALELFVAASLIVSGGKTPSTVPTCVISRCVCLLEHYQVPKYGRSLDTDMIGSRSRLPRGYQHLEKDPEFFRSVHLVGEGLAREKAEIKRKEEELWRNKVSQISLHAKGSRSFEAVGSRKY